MRLSQVFIASLTILASAAHADVRSCLSSASNDQLLSELGSRLGGSAGSSGKISAEAYCNSYYFKLETTDLSTGLQPGKFELSMNTSAECTNWVTKVSPKLRRLHDGGVIAVCNSYYLYRVTVIAGGKIVSRNDSLSTSKECEAQADAINGR